MKKILFVFSMIMSVVNASAQFVTYEPVYVPQQSYTPSAGYGTPFNVYEPVYVDSYQCQQQQRKPQMSQVTLTGYYKKGNRWQSTPIRVGVTDEKVILLSVKSGYNWANCGNAASMVGGFDAEEIRDNFTYKAFNSLYGTIYF